MMKNSKKKLFAQYFENNSSYTQIESVSLQFGHNLVLLQRILNLDLSKGEQKDAEGFIDELFDCFIGLAPSGIFPSHFSSLYEELI